MPSTLQRARSWDLVFTIGAIAAAALSFAASLYLSARVHSALDKLQHEHSVARVASVLQAVDQNAHHLVDYASGYAMWDDAYQYLQSRDPLFLQTNFSESVLAATPVQLAAFYTVGGELIFATAVDEQGKTAPVPEAMRDFARLEGFFSLTKPGQSRSRVEWIGDRAYLLAICPVTDSAGTAPIRGYLAFGTLIGGEMLARLQLLTDSQVSVQAQKAAFRGDFQIATPDLGVAEVNIEESKDAFKALALFPEDNDEQSSVIFHIDLPASASRTGRLLAELISSTFLLITAGFALFMALSIREIFHRRAEIQRRILEAEELMAARRNADRLAGEAAAADQAKSTFLAMISHEIRTPLNAVVGYADLLRNNPDEDLMGRLEIIAKSAATLQHLVADILDFSKIEAGKLDIHVRATSIRNLVRELCDAFGPAADARGNHIRAGIRPTVPENLLLDDLRVRQIIGNLLSNAVKFTDDGEISLVVEWEAAPASTGDAAGSTLRITVEDEGIGIAPEKEPALFEPFSQGESTTARRYGGAGLGLVICRRLCDLMGGSIEHEPKPGKGSRFVVRLPAQATAEAVHEPWTTTPSALRHEDDLSILVVDDNAVNARLLKAVLKRLGRSAESVLGGEEALEYFKMRSPDVVFTDIHMPGMDGLALARHIRAFEKEMDRAPCLLIAVTADTLVTDSEQSLAAGMDGHINKPFKLEDIDKALSLRSGRNDG